MNTQHRCSRVINVSTRADQVPSARRAIVDTLRAWGVSEDDEAVYAVRLIASELLTNVVCHASAVTTETNVVVELVDGVWIRLGVRDGHSDCPAPAAVDVDAVNGRGLMIVHELVTELEGLVFIERTDDGGKTVWIELSCAQPERAGAESWEDQAQLEMGPEFAV
jgi:anti-sigma regulatory factor (Ser/Thr protein kinase)